MNIRYAENKLDLLTIKMMEYYTGDAKRIQHFIKVHSLAHLIGVKENLTQHELYILEAAALTHDIGIKKQRSFTTAVTVRFRNSLDLI